MNFEKLNNESNTLLGNNTANTTNSESQDVLSTNADGYQQVLNNHDITQARLESQAVKNTSEQQSPNPDNFSEIKKQENESNSSSAQNNSEQPSKQENEYQQETNKKLDALYFIGVNSILLNFLMNINVTKCLGIQGLLFILSNTITYLTLYKQKQVKSLFKTAQSKSISGFTKTRNSITKKRVLIGLGIILAISLTTMTIVSTIKTHKLQKQVNELNNSINNSSQRLSQLNYSYENIQNQGAQLHILMAHAQNNFEQQNQVIQQLQQQVNYLSERMKLKHNEIQSLKEKILNIKQQNQETAKPPQGPEQEKPSYPKLQQPMKENILYIEL